MGGARTARGICCATRRYMSAPSLRMYVVPPSRHAASHASQESPPMSRPWWRIAEQLLASSDGTSRGGHGDASLGQDLSMRGGGIWTQIWACVEAGGYAADRPSLFCLAVNSGARRYTYNTLHQPGTDPGSRRRQRCILPLDQPGSDAQRSDAAVGIMLLYMAQCAACARDQSQAAARVVRLRFGAALKEHPLGAPIAALRLTRFHAILHKDKHTKTQQSWLEPPELMFEGRFRRMRTHKH